MLYKPDIGHVSSINHGRIHEKVALEELSNLLGVVVNPCGLFIDKKHQFLGATPDGLINKDTLVEIKCPVTPFKIGIDEAIRQGKMHFWRVDKKTGVIKLNKNSDWYIQVQGQMHICEIPKCLLVVWYGHNKMKIETILKDDQFWKEKMEAKLISFYFDCMLPELVDPRLTRNKPIRDPPYVKKKENKENVCSDDNITKYTKQTNTPRIATTSTISFNHF